MKNLDYYNGKIESLKAAIKRMQVEKRLLILRQRERDLERTVRLSQSTGAGHE